MSDLPDFGRSSPQGHVIFAWSAIDFMVSLPNGEDFCYFVSSVQELYSERVACEHRKHQPRATPQSSD
eukprot:3917379-Pyramimonas_sp.AAC.1